ncbi:type I restriction endonuclease EcoKI subunit S [Acinetobacter sp. BEC1-S18-ESBL-01]|jgi:type I restriction enzyme S subunit|uniref:restriction endonuclease subunit S n=1 Tax=Acinetobacter TaxID=469 RepID=UPI0002CFE04F|nr:MULTISPECIES: restriction endonuclease subunit S [Acinetobacter]AMO41451.1 hypothetical protein A0J50_12920 [Acinetobacter sp. DUT-2]ENW10272.1 hypothetical protein F930_02912 [Acinetobacter pittii ANC 3678]MCU4469559.1 restriction endonuclease subunit S [Acinetobacter pittii]MCU4484011.1 restriction endonuclease subunit S [Acinetobacter pittii]MDR3040929.1 restriction endonuclease subunit S [Acinetobacter pittii]
MSQFELPEGWFNATIQDVAEVKGGKRLPKGKALTDQKTAHAYIRVTDMNNGSIDQSDIRYIDEETYKEISNYFISKDDLYISIAGTIGLVGDIPNELDGANLTENAAKICSLMGVEKHYLKYVLNSLIAKEQFEDKVTSSGQPKLALFRIRDCKFPLPPLAEQQVIADKLDTLLAQVESIKARLERIPEILKQFRQSVLAAAVSGKLTEEWRVAKGITIETWKYEAAKNVCEKVQSGSTPRENPFDQNGTVPFLKVYNIVDQKIDFDYKPQFITSETHSKGSSARSVAFPNDVLMNIVGPPLGKVAILTNQFPEWNLNQAITLFRVKKELLDHKYLYYVLCEGALVREVMPETKGSVGQVNISLSQCREAILPVPSIEEQREVVLCIDKLFNNADVIDTYVHSALNRVNNLTQSILAKAFRGELTAGWREANTDLISGENSAEALLKRIKAERESAKPTTKRGRAET